jgi:putative glutamine amidotransferase
MDKPKIGVTTAWSVETWGDSIESRGYNYVGRTYIEAIISAGGISILIPQVDHDDIDEILASVDGILFTGGGDAKKFSKDDLPGLKEQQPTRYDFEAKLLKSAKEANKPILGICRGFQMIIEVFGGSLSASVVDGHKQNIYGGKPWHEVSIKEGSFLYSIVNDKKWDVNSFHIQKVEKVPDNFIATAVANDGVIEAVESIDAFIVGTQFHPEELLWGDKRAELVFEKFIEKCKKGGCHD